MPIQLINTGNTFANGDQVTAAKLNAVVNSATFVAGTSGTTDGITLDINGSGQIYVKDSNITAAKLASDSVTTAKIVDANVTPEKLSSGAPTWSSSNTVIAASLDFAAISTDTTTGTYERSGNTVTVTMSDHGMTNGMVAALSFVQGTGGAATSGSYPISFVSNSQFRITDPTSGTITGNPRCDRTAYYGTSTVRGSQTVAGNLTVSNNATVSKDLTVTGGLTVAGEAFRPLTLGTSQNSTSGTTISFNDIPSWVKRITIIFAGVSVSGANDLEVVLGTGTSGSPVYVTSGYSGGGSRQSSSGTVGGAWSSGFLIALNNASTAASGHMKLTKITGNTWVSSAVIGGSAGDFSLISGGTIALGSALTQVRVKTTSTDTFDAGQINVLYE